FIALQTAGNLATTQAVIGHLQNALILQHEPNLYSINTMFEVADLVGKTLKCVLEDISSDTQEQMNYAGSILGGGQIKGGDMQR
ncbi:peptidase, partial [Acinetobacter baumannii]